LTELKEHLQDDFYSASCKMALHLQDDPASTMWLQIRKMTLHLEGGLALVWQLAVTGFK